MFQSNDLTCQNFPLEKKYFNFSLNPWLPDKCGTLKDITPKDLHESKCFTDKTLFIIGDSRAKQLTSEIAILLNDYYDTTR